MRVFASKKALSRLMAFMGFVGILSTAPLSAGFAQSSDSNSALMARQQMRLNTIEDNLKTVRGTLETEFRAMRMKIEELAIDAEDKSRGHATAIKSLKAQMGELGDTLDILNQRLRRSIELSSDIEFRVLRLEKRMQTLLSLSNDELTDAILQDGVSAAGTAPAVSMSRDNETGGATWTVEKDEALNAELDKSEADNASSAAAEGDAVPSAQATEPDTTEAGTTEAGTTAVAETDQTTNAAADQSASTETSAANTAAPQDSAVDEVESEDAPAIVRVLPEGTAEDHYRFAFGSMLQNDLETAEAGFAEFRQLHPNDARAADVLYWLGRVQFIQGDYGKSAMSFTEFNSEFPDDARLPEAILMIAESVLNFATAEQACQIFADLPNMLDQPSESFMSRLGELTTAASCES